MNPEPDWIDPLFCSVDESDVDTFLSFLTDEACFRFANAPTLKGKPAIRDMLEGFFASLKGLSHQLTDTWQQGDAVICHGIVTYKRHDDTTLTVPFANIFRLKGDLIDEYLIYVDASELYTGSA